MHLRSKKEIKGACREKENFYASRLASLAAWISSASTTSASRPFTSGRSNVQNAPAIQQAKKTSRKKIVISRGLIYLYKENGDAIFYETLTPEHFWRSNLLR